MSTDQLRALQALILGAADTINLWRDSAIMGLGLLVIGCLWVAASVLGDGS